MRALITGASGFLGVHLVKKLISDGHNVATFQRKELEPVHGVSSYFGDIEESNSINYAINESQPDVVYHLAAQSSPKFSWSEPKHTLRTNLDGTINVLDAIKTYSHHSRLVMVSSSAVYGEHPLGLALSERDIPNPVSPYGLSKLSAEIMCQIYAKQFGMDCVIVRPFFIIGPFKSGDVCSEWAKQIVCIENGSQKRLEVGNLNIVRDFMHVTDAIAAITLISQKGNEGQIYNISTGRGVALRVVLEVLLRLSQSKAQVVEKTQRPNAHDELIKIGANHNLKSLGWNEYLNHEIALADILNYWRLQIGN